MDKDNEIYVTSNGELYKKGVEQAIYPQTNYTTQQFYTKEEYEKLQAENERLKEENKELESSLVSQAKCANKLCQALQEIRDMAEKMYNTNDEDVERDLYIKLQDKINEVIGAEE